MANAVPKMASAGTRIEDGDVPVASDATGRAVFFEGNSGMLPARARRKQSARSGSTTETQKHREERAQPPAAVARRRRRARNSAGRRTASGPNLVRRALLRLCESVVDS